MWNLFSRISSKNQRNACTTKQQDDVPFCEPRCSTQPVSATDMGSPGTAAGSPADSQMPPEADRSVATQCRDCRVSHNDDWCQCSSARLTTARLHLNTSLWLTMLALVTSSQYKDHQQHSSADNAASHDPLVCQCIDMLNENITLPQCANAKHCWSELTLYDSITGLRQSSFGLRKTRWMCFLTVLDPSVVTNFPQTYILNKILNNIF